MATTSPPGVPRRTATTDRFSVSVVSVAVPAPRGEGSVDGRIAVPLLRRARALGVTGFDLSRADDPLAAARPLGEAIAPDDPDVVIFVGVPEELSSNARGVPPRDGAGVTAWLAGLRTALGGARRLVVIGGSTRSDAIDAALDRARASGEILDVVRPLGDTGAEGASIGSDVRGAELSLLRPGAAHALGALPPSTRPFLVAFDPFAGGVLDGSRIERAPVEFGPRTPPPSLRELERTYGGVTALSFLSRPGRPLYRAALEFVVGWPWVLTAVVPLPPPGRLDDVLAAGPWGPLAPDELARLGFGPAPSVRV